MGRAEGARAASGLGSIGPGRVAPAMEEAR